MQTNLQLINYKPMNTFCSQTHPVPDLILKKQLQVMAIRRLRDCVSERLGFWRSFPVRNPRLDQFYRSLRYLDLELETLEEELACLEMIGWEELMQAAGEA